MAKADEKETSEVVITGSVQEVAPYNPGMDTWGDLTGGADQVLGHDLAKDDLLDALENVPFVITRVVFRKGVVKNGEQAAYASCEIVVAPEEVLKKRRVNLDNLPFEPGSQVIFNDGSTGIYRQIVAYLAATGRISIPGTLPEQGAYGESRYDVPPTEWEHFHAGTVTFDGDGFPCYTIDVRLSCPRGLRLSEYTNDYNPSGSKTRYLA